MTEDITITTEQFDGLVQSADRSLELEEQLKAAQAEIAGLQERLKDPDSIENMPKWKRDYLNGYFGINDKPEHPVKPQVTDDLRVQAGIFIECVKRRFAPTHVTVKVTLGAALNHIDLRLPDLNVNVRADGLDWLRSEQEKLEADLMHAKTWWRG